MVCRHRHSVDTGDQGSDDHLGKACQRALQRHRQAQPPNSQKAGLFKGIPALHGDAHRGVFQKNRQRKENAHRHIGTGGGKGRAAHAPARAPHGKGSAQQGNCSGGVDEQRVQDHIQHIGEKVQKHGSFGISRTAKNGAEHVGAKGKGHGAGHNAEIQRGVSPNFLLGPEHGGQGKGKRHTDSADEQAEKDHKPQRLPGDAFGVLLPAGA